MELLHNVNNTMITHVLESMTLRLYLSVSLGVNAFLNRFIFRTGLRGPLERPQFKYPIKEKHELSYVIPINKPTKERDDSSN